MTLNQKILFMEVFIVLADRFKITYDEVGRMGINVHELYDIFELNAELSFEQWWEYMKTYHLAENEHFINEWVTLETAKDICRYEILRLAEKKNFADPILFCYIAEEILLASEHAEKAEKSEGFVNNFKNGMMTLLEEECSHKVRGENNG